MLKVIDVHASEIIAKAELAYFELKHAQLGYQKALSTGEKEGSILLTIDNEETEGIDAVAELSVEDAETLAYQILGLCSAVKK